jgi:hypothetical protein
MPYVGAPPPAGRSDAGVPVSSNDEVGIGVTGGAAGRAGAFFFGALRTGADRAGLRRGAAFFVVFLLLLRRGLAVRDVALRAALPRLGALRFAFFLATVVPP